MNIAKLIMIAFIFTMMQTTNIIAGCTGSSSDGCVATERTRQQVGDVRDVGASGGVTVSGRPDIAFVSDNDINKDDVYHVTLQATCSGATSPRIGWGRHGFTMPTSLKKRESSSS